jgi:XTP/dITP diphosphohydrolase
MRLLIASRNKNKVREIGEMLKDLKLDIFSSADIPSLPEIKEDKKTTRENAIKKALETAKHAAQKGDFLVLADDSALEVDALAGEPGVKSARFAGEKCTGHDNNVKLLGLMQKIPQEKRGARFRCVLAIARTSPKPELIEAVEGICVGAIAFEERGGGGFGYDPIFIPDGQVKTFAELSPAVKNRISHRARAVEKARLILERLVPRE